MIAKENINKIKSNPKIRLFLVLLFLSAVYWFFTSLSEVYSYKTIYTIHYTNLPKNLYFQQTPPNLIPVQIKATGFEIIKQKVFPNTVTFDLKSFNSLSKYKFYYQPNKENSSFINQTDNSTIVKFITDSVFVYLGKLKTKKVPIASKIKMEFKPGYKLRAPYQLKPDSLLIKGPELFVDSINTIQTIDYLLKDIDQDISIEVDLKLPRRENLTYFNTSKTLLKAAVAKFTEGLLTLPIQSPKTKEGTNIELFPKTATLKYEVAFENYQDIDTQSFTISCVYPKDSTKTLQLVLSNKPDYIKNYSIEPKEITYLIKKLKK